MRVLVVHRAAVAGTVHRSEGGGTVTGAEISADPTGCTGSTATGAPCKGRPGKDRRCAAHKAQDEA